MIGQVDSDDEGVETKNFVKRDWWAGVLSGFLAQIHWEELTAELQFRDTYRAQVMHCSW